MKNIVSGINSFQTQENDEIYDEFLCPILKTKMIDPVIASDGFSYERKAIENWFKQSFNEPISPMTGNRLTSRTLISNHTLKALLIEASHSNFGLLQPIEFYCPLGQTLMQDPLVPPVVAFDGFTYDKTAIRQYFENNSDSPITGKRASDSEKNQLFENHILRSLIKNHFSLPDKLLDVNISPVLPLKIRETFRVLSGRKDFNQDFRTDIYSFAPKILLLHENFWKNAGFRTLLETISVEELKALSCGYRAIHPVCKKLNISVEEFFRLKASVMVSLLDKGFKLGTQLESVGVTFKEIHDSFPHLLEDLINHMDVITDVFCLINQGISLDQLDQINVLSRNVILKESKAVVELMKHKFTFDELSQLEATRLQVVLSHCKEIIFLNESKVLAEIKTDNLFFIKTFLDHAHEFVVFRKAGISCETIETVSAKNLLRVFDLPPEKTALLMAKTNVNLDDLAGLPNQTRDCIFEFPMEVFSLLQQHVSWQSLVKASDTTRRWAFEHSGEVVDFLTAVKILVQNDAPDLFNQMNLDRLKDCFDDPVKKEFLFDPWTAELLKEKVITFPKLLEFSTKELKDFLDTQRTLKQTELKQKKSRIREGLDQYLGIGPRFCLSFPFGNDRTKIMALKDDIEKCETPAEIKKKLDEEMQQAQKSLNRWGLFGGQSTTQSLYVKTIQEAQATLTGIRCAL